VITGSRESLYQSDIYRTGKSREIISNDEDKADSGIKRNGNPAGSQEQCRYTKLLAKAAKGTSRPVKTERITIRRKAQD
jgi:hypothetical protein